MAGYKGHLTGAAVVTGAYVVALGALGAAGGVALDRLVDLGSGGAAVAFEAIGAAAVMMGLGLMFGLWPDVDTNSKGQNVFYALFLAVDVALIWGRHFEEAAYLGLFCILPVIGKHRGWTHTTWAMVLIPAPLVLAPMLLFPEQDPLAGLPFYGAAVAGYFSHLLLDGLIVPLPWKRRR